MVGAPTPMSAASRIQGILVTGIATILVIYFAYSIAEILLLLFISVLFSLYLGMLTDFFQLRMGMPRALGLAEALVVTVLGVVAVGWLIVPPVAQETQELLRALPAQLERWEKQLLRLAESSAFAGQLLGPLPQGQSYVGSILQEIRGYFAGLVPYVFSGVRFVIHFVSVLVMGAYLCLRPTLYREGLIALFPPRHRPFVRDVLADLSHTLRAWIAGQILAMSVLGLLTWVGLVLLGVPYALAFGVFTGLAAIVPFFGTLFSTLLPAVVVVGTDGALKALAVIGLGVVVHLVEANVVAPMIMERKVDLPPVLTLLSVLVMAHVLEVIGLLVAVPVLASVLVLVRRVYVLEILEEKEFRRPVRERPLEVQLPPEPEALAHPSAETNVRALLER
ncbi:MAG: AI-2E family transporter [Gemmatimonadetes bacterium]|nr:AI-2E family transporter [Gemmatimonadota bacterium]